ncbi:hydroxyacylglutathione hydrolase [Shewanella sp. HN-41]|uniref:hydroxyacylglutathione hydrolase n=1 Tax=Shewanella sp. HN-41 TaxID=327275 RepID=UPI0002125F0E|nr:hydroxyacylglutathione hydrolase [Shewanella sp. HN-41]EGM69855.1 hydroxyacylglutathione hydrolase [Shewanella sp. HN-41]
MLTITAINAFNDNYIWVLRQGTLAQVYVVDPGDAKVVIAHIESHRLELAGILLTHHHRDHTDGIAELVEYVKQTTQSVLKVYGPHSEAINGINVPLDPVATMELSLPFLKHKMQILSVPGHTAGHIAYVIEDALFCGDTLFSAGCGRLFEGTPQQMLHSLTQLANLPANTKVYCAHEYTLANLKFALTVDPNNAALKTYAQQAADMRAQGKATIPSNIALEQAVNPFLRTDDLNILSSIKQHFSVQDPSKLDKLTCFTLLRQWKDIF